MSAPLPFSLADGYIMQEDFLDNGNSAATTALGTQDWIMETINNASATVYLVTTNTGVGQYGVVRDTTAAAGTDGEWYHLDDDSIVLGPSGGSFRMKFRFPDIAGNLIAGNNLKFGLYDAPTPLNGVYVTVASGIPTLYIDSTANGDVYVTAANVPSLTSGTTCVKGTWYDIRVDFWGENASGGPDSARMFINGEFGGELVGVGLIDDGEEVEPGFEHYATAADTLEADFDFFEVFLAR